jgi:protein SSD1
LNRRNRNEAYFGAPSGHKLPGFEDAKAQPDILIPGTKLRNRALEGDIVVIELLEGAELAREEKRRTDTKREKGIEEGRRNDKARGEGVADDSDDDDLSDFESEGPRSPPPSPVKVPLADRPEFQNPLAKVVGILERVGDRHPYAGTVVLDPYEDENAAKDSKGNGARTLGKGKGYGKGRDQKEFPRLVWFRPVG